MLRYYEGVNLSLSRLSFKARVLLERFGSLDEAYAFLQEKKTFTVIAGIGLKTDLELREALDRYRLECDISTLKGEVSDSAFISELFSFYQKLKVEALARTQNVLSALEGDFSDLSIVRNQVLFIDRVFLCPFDFYSLRKAGRRTVEQLESMKRQIIELNQRLNVEQNADASAEVDQAKALWKFLNGSISVNRIMELLERPLEAAVHFVALSLLNRCGYGKLKTRLIKSYYFDDKLFGQSELSVKLNCSRERVRQLVNDSRHVLKMVIWHSLKKELPQLTLERRNILDSRFIIENSDCEIVYGDEVLKPNSRFYQLVGSVFLEQTHFDLFSRFELSNFVPKALIVEQETILISHSGEKDYGLVELFKWIDNEIYLFELDKFEYDLEVLILRYFQENQCNSSPEIIRECYRLIQPIIKVEWPERKSAKTRIIRNQRIDSICEICESLLIERDSFVKTKDFITKLHAEGIEIETGQLLSLLNDHSEAFVRVGNGKWQLRMRIQDNSLNGSIRDIVSRKLIESKNPVHISVFLQMLATVRPITEHSFMTNLRSVDDEKFIFLNCGFIGLRGMDYDRYWLDVPRIKPQHLRGFSLEQAMERSPKDIGGYFERVYGYPKIHVDYLLDNRVARSAPDSHPGALVTSKRLPLASFNEFMSLTGGVVDFKSQNGRRFKVLSIEGEVMYYEKLDSKVEVVWKLNLSEVYRAYIEFDDFKLVNFKKILPLTYSAAKALLIHIGFLKDGI